MKPRRPYGPVAALCIAVFALVPSMWAQDLTAPRNTGFPQDWSQGHIVFSRDTLALHPDLIYREPRVLFQAMQRWQPANSDVFRAVDPVQASADVSGDKRDWNVNLMKGRISLNMFPAKFSFDPGGSPRLHQRLRNFWTGRNWRYRWPSQSSCLQQSLFRHRRVMWFCSDRALRL